MIEQRDWSNFCDTCEDVGYGFEENVALLIEDYRCIECFYNDVETELFLNAQ